MSKTPIQQPEAWWLARLDVHGNPTLVDGMHGERAGAERAFYLYQQLGFAEEKRYAIAQVLLTEAVGSDAGVDQDALSTVKSTMDWAKGREKASE